jgi:hypothetical protein
VIVHAIWKYTFNVEDDFAIEMPRSAKIVNVQVQAGITCMWAIVDPKSDTVIRRFKVVGTGQPFEYSDRVKHVGTFQLAGGRLVYHLLEIE